MKPINRFRIYNLFLFFAAWIVMVSGCQHDPKNDHIIDEGIIIYQVEFLDIEKDGLLASMLPGEIKEYFKDSKIRIDFNIGKGLMKLVYITDSDEESIIFLFEMFGKKFASNNSRENILKEKSIMPKFSIKHRIGTKEIAGFKCKKAIIYDSEQDSKADIYYSEQVKADNPNWHTPFEEIDYMLFKYPIDYQMSKHKFKMILTASSVEAVEVPDDLFTIPADYKIVSKEEIDKKIDELMALSIR